MNAKPVKGIPGYYVTKDGKVFSKKGKKTKPVATNTNKDNGYDSVVLYHNGKPHFKYVHQLVADVWTDKPEGKSVVGHKDGDKQNVNADNLEWQDESENTQHAYDKGLAKGATGMANGAAKLSDKDVKAIRNSDATGAKLADLHDIDPSTVSLIRNKKRR